MNTTKTAISIPQDVFDQAEQIAADMGISRSELYTRALRRLLREQKILAVRAQLAEALADEKAGTAPPRLAEALHEIASTTIRRAIERGESTW